MRMRLTGAGQRADSGRLLYWRRMSASSPAGTGTDLSDAPAEATLRVWRSAPRRWQAGPLSGSRPHAMRSGRGSIGGCWVFCAEAVPRMARNKVSRRMAQDAAVQRVHIGIQRTFTQVHVIPCKCPIHMAIASGAGLRTGRGSRSGPEKEEAGRRRLRQFDGFVFFILPDAFPPTLKPA